MSFTVQLSDTTSILKANLPYHQFSEGSNYEIALTSFSTWNSIPNVTKNNNMFYYEKEKKLEIPIGSYEIEDLERFINEKIKDKVNSVPVDKKELLGENSIVLRGNRQTLKSEIICRYNIDFTKPNNIGKMLGFKNVLLPAYKKAESNSLVDIMSTDLLQITCNVAGGSWANEKPSHVIHTFVIDVSPGYKLLSVPKNLI